MACMSKELPTNRLLSLAASSATLHVILYAHIFPVDGLQGRVPEKGSLHDL